MSDDPRLINLRNNAARFIKNEPTELELIDSLLSQEMNLQVFAERAGWHNLIINHNGQQVRYHRERDPFSEFSEQLGQSKAPEILVCIGTGFGYQWLRAVQHIEGIKEIIIADPLFESLFIFLTEHDLGNLLPANSSVLFAPKHRILTSYLWTRLNRYHPSNLQFIQLTSMNTLAPDYLADTAQEIQEGWTRHEVFLLSLGDQFEEVSNNTRTNFTAEKTKFTLQEGCGKHERCLIVGSGPSLDNLAPSLPHIAEHVHVIAAGSAAAIVKKHGVDPDLTIISDPQMVNKIHFRNNHSEPVAFDPVIDSRILSDFQGKRLTIHTGHAITDIFFSFLNIPFLKCWGTVTSSALSLAQLAGFEEIALIGMEFSFKGSDQHAAHYAAKGMRGKNKDIRDIRGRITKTNKTMKGYADYVTKQIREIENEGARIINLMEGGILGAGTMWTARQYLASMNPTGDGKRNIEWAKETGGFERARNEMSDYFQREWAVEIEYLKQCDGREFTLTDIFRKKLLAALEGGCLEEARAFEQSLIYGMDQETVERNKHKLISRLQYLRDDILISIYKQL